MHLVWGVAAIKFVIGAGTHCALTEKYSTGVYVQEKFMRKVPRNGLFFTATVTGIFFFVWAVTDVLPIGSLQLSVTFLAVTFATVVVLFWRIRLDPLYALMVLGIPIGLIFSIVEIVRIMQQMENPDSLPIEVSSALTVAVVGGLLSAVGSFGHQRNANIRSRSLTQWECLALAVLLVVLLLGMTFNSNVLVAILDWSSAKVLLSILLVGLGVAVFKGIDFREGLPNLFVCAALIGAAISTIGWILTSLSDDMKGMGPAMAIGLLTMLYGICLYVLSFLLHLTAPGELDDDGFTTKNWHLVEGFTFLFFMNLGPPTLFELVAG